MEIVKTREKSDLLRGMTYLDKRINLHDTDKRYLSNLDKGFNGEIRFDQFLNKFLTNEAIVLNDLLLVSKGTTFQIDSLIISSETIYVYEVKNFSGNYVMESGELMTTTGMDINNPLIQLNRISSFIKSLIKEWGFKYRVESNVVFVNDRFTLYQSRVEDPIIVFTQIRDHLTEVNHKSRYLTRDHHYLARKLIQTHKNGVPHQKQLPYYEYKDFKKGLSCSECGSFDLLVTQRSSYCKSCFKQHSIKEIVLENIEEYTFLFPDQKITTSTINEWCGAVVNIDKIRKILKENFAISGTTNGTYYE